MTKAQTKKVKMTKAQTEQHHDESTLGFAVHSLLAIYLNRTHSFAGAL